MSADRRKAEFGWPGGDKPGDLQFSHKISTDLQAALEAVLKPVIGPCRKFRALTPPAGAAGRFTVETDDGVEWFVRVSARWGEPALEQAITGFLQARGFAANHLVAAGLRMNWEGTALRVDVRRRVHGRHFNGSLDDLRALSAVLARCHELLREFPEANRVRDIAGARFASLDRTRRQMQEALKRENFGFFCHDPAWAREHAEWLRMLTAEFEPRCDLLEASQCLHAQVHQANVLYEPDPVLVDWEEAVRTFAPVQWDLAYFVQRFCLHDGASADLLAERLKTVREAYGAPLGDVTQAMRHVAWFSAVILVDYHQAAIWNPVSEYDKFVRLEEQARELQPLLETFRT